MFESNKKILTVLTITMLFVFKLIKVDRSLYKLAKANASCCLVSDSLFKKESLTASANFFILASVGGSTSMFTTGVGVGKTDGDHRFSDG